MSNYCTGCGEKEPVCYCNYDYGDDSLNICFNCGGSFSTEEMYFCDDKSEYDCDFCINCYPVKIKETE